MSIMRRNKDQMEPLLRLAESIGVESVKFNLTMPIARGEKLHESGDTLSIEELFELGSWVENNLSDSTDLRIVYDHPAAFRPLVKCSEIKETDAADAEFWAFWGYWPTAVMPSVASGKVCLN